MHNSVCDKWFAEKEGVVPTSRGPSYIACQATLFVSQWFEARTPGRKVLSYLATGLCLGIGVFVSSIKYPCLAHEFGANYSFSFIGKGLLG